MVLIMLVSQPCVFNQPELADNFVNFLMKFIMNFRLHIFISMSAEWISKCNFVELD